MRKMNIAVILLCMAFISCSTTKNLTSNDSELDDQDDKKQYAFSRVIGERR